jgi:hypothetical protein
VGFLGLLTGIAMVILWSLVFVPTSAPRRGWDVNVAVAGSREVVFNWSTQRCADGLGDVPDLPAHAFRDAHGQVQLIAGNDPSRRFVGPDLNHVKHSCAVVLRSDHNPYPGAFDDHEWLAAEYTLNGNTVYAFVHDEYHGYDFPSECPITTSAKYLACWYNAITLATSTNGGATYTDASPPRLIFGIPYRYAPGQGPDGMLRVSNIVHNLADGYYYALGSVTVLQASIGSCLMRTKTVADPTSWRAWTGGSSFDITFVDPYGPNPSPSAHLCRPIAAWKPGNFQPDSLTYNTVARQWLLVGMGPAGVYYSLSPNLINWGQPRLFYRAQVSWSFRCGDADPLEYPSLIDPASPSRNFETSGSSAYLYFTLFRYSCPQPFTNDRDLVRVPIAITPR